MSKISAFVGHSFDDSDKELIQSFLDFFDTLKKSGLIHEWEHAEEAQASGVDQKVREIMQGKTLFIGICTKKERVIRDDKIKKWNFIGRVIAKAADCEWKTSDWILQELGYSLGLNMKAILLIEDGVRSINGLHGNLEFIKFERQNPSLSFQKIIQQIRSVDANKSDSEFPDESAKATEVEDSDSTVDQPNINWEKPDINWKYSEYLTALHIAIWNKKPDVEKAIYESHKKVLDPDKTQLLKWEGDYLLLKQKWKNESALGSLLELVKANPDNKYLHFQCGKALEQYKEFGKAFDEYCKALDSGSTFEINFLYKAVGCLAEYKGVDAAKAFMEKNKEKIIKNDDEKFEYIRVYSNLFKKDSPHVYCSLIEAALSLKPDSSSLRFDLAYKYSDLKLKKLSLFHYILLCQTNPTAANWNNLGVEYEKNNLSIKSITSYHASAELKGTLAMSNLAYRFLNSGFEKEAREICNKALQIENYDERIPQTLTSINEKIESENKEIESLDGAVIPVQTFFIKYAMSLTMPLIKDTSGRVKSEKCELNYSISKGKMEAFGVFEKEVTETGLGLLSNPYKSSPNPPAKSVISNKITYQGEIRGSAGTFKISRVRSKNQEGAISVLSSLLSPGETTNDGIFYYDDGCKQFEVMEFDSDGQPTKTYKLSVIS